MLRVLWAFAGGQYDVRVVFGMGRWMRLIRFTPPAFYARC